mgnify:CR=1 FL=1
MTKQFKSLLDNVYLKRAQERNLKLYVLGLISGGKANVDEAFDDNLQTDIQIVERILYG